MDRYEFLKNLAGILPDRRATPPGGLDIGCLRLPVHHLDCEDALRRIPERFWNLIEVAAATYSGWFRKSQCPIDRAYTMHNFLTKHWPKWAQPSQLAATLAPDLEELASLDFFGLMRKVGYEAEIVKIHGDHKKSSAVYVTVAEWYLDALPKVPDELARTITSYLEYFRESTDAPSNPST